MPLEVSAFMEITIELVEELLPVLKDNGVDLYINGHDHCLQHISSRDCPIEFLTSGGDSKVWRGVYTPNSDKLQFFYDGQGFMSMELMKRDVKLAFSILRAANSSQLKEISVLSHEM